MGLQSKPKKDAILRTRVTTKFLKLIDKEAKRIGVTQSEMVRIMCIKYFGEKR